MKFSVFCNISSMEPSTGVLVENVVFKFSKKQSPVLDNINITIPKGAIYCLLGPSGCGKTTMIKVTSFSVARLRLTTPRVLGEIIDFNIN